MAFVSTNNPRTVVLNTRVTTMSGYFENGTKMTDVDNSGRQGSFNLVDDKGNNLYDVPEFMFNVIN